MVGRDLAKHIRVGPEGAEKIDTLQGQAWTAIVYNRRILRRTSRVLMKAVEHIGKALRSNFGSTTTASHLCNIDATPACHHVRQQVEFFHKAPVDRVFQLPRPSARAHQSAFGCDRCAIGQREKCQKVFLRYVGPGVPTNC